MEKQLKSNHYTNCLLQDILKQNKSTLNDFNTGFQEKFRNVFNNFPLTGLSDVVEMEEKLKDSASYHLMVPSKIYIINILLYLLTTFINNFNYIEN
jgi:hypothetical protein